MGNSFLWNPIDLSRKLLHFMGKLFLVSGKPFFRSRRDFSASFRCNQKNDKVFYIRIHFNNLFKKTFFPLSILVDSFPFPIFAFI